VSLAQLQFALARLATSDAARAAFDRDPNLFMREFELGAADRARLARVAGARLHAYADSLDRKRANEAARLLPLAAAALGPAFRAAFMRHARRTVLPQTADRYRADAIAFARTVSRGPDAARPTVALLAFEAGALAAASGVPRPRLARYRYDPADLARRLAVAEHLDGAEPRPTIVATWGEWSVRVRLPRATQSAATRFAPDAR